MSYQSPPYIKPDPDGAAFYQQSQPDFSGGNQDLMFSRGGFSSFDGNSPSSSMIPEDDLLESLNGTAGSYTDMNVVMSQDLQTQQYSTPQNLGVGSYFSPPTRNVQMPSASPFNDYSQPPSFQQSLSRSAGVSSSAPRQLRPESHTQRFLNINEYSRPQKQSGFQSVSIPNSAGSWSGAGGTPESFDQTLSPPTVAIKGEPGDKQSLLLLEKRRRRRESHNAGMYRNWL